MNSIAITKPASKPKSPWIRNTVTRNCHGRENWRREEDEVERQINCFRWKAARTSWGCDFMLLLSRRCEHYGKVPSWNGLDSLWIILCQYESCPSQSTNSAFTTTEKGKGFEGNRAKILGLWSTGSGHAAALKFPCFIGLAPISMSFMGSSISQPIHKILNANRVNQKIISCLLTLEFWLHWLRSIYKKIIYRAPSWEICTCSVLTVTLLLLYGKLIPLRFFPNWCDNLITLGCRWILVFRCFLKVKNRRVVRAFWVPGLQPLDQIGWYLESMLSERLPTKPCLRILIILLIKN